MRCLCCGKEISESAGARERANEWHDRCVREFFGTEELPVLEVTKRQMERLEYCGKLVQKYSARLGLDRSELFLRVVFSYFIGNSDMHLKNFSLRETAPGNREFCLSPAYDMLPVNLILPEDKEETALTLNGKKRNLTRKDFLAFAESCDLPERAAQKMLEKLCSLQDSFFLICEESHLPEDERERMKALIGKRIRRIKR